MLIQYPGKIVIDLVRQWKEVDYVGKDEGISWGDINVNHQAQNSEKVIFCISNFSIFHLIIE